MSLGAITSAPARAWEVAVRASSSRRGVVVDAAVGSDRPAVPVARVLAQAEVGDDDQLGMRVLDGAGGELDDALVVPGSRALLVLARRQPEQQDGGKPELLRLAGFGYGVGDRQVVDAWHRGDRLPAVDPVGDEQRIDEIGRG